MSAAKAERWATRALLAVARSGVDMPDGAAEAGMATLAVIGLRALSFISFEEAEPLLDEMMECVQIIPDPEKNPNFVRQLVEDDIEEVSTRLYLRAEVFELHTGFSMLDMISKSQKSAAGLI